MNVAAATASTATEPWFNGGRMKCDAIAVTTMTSADAASSRRARRPQNARSRSRPVATSSLRISRVMR